MNPRHITNLLCILRTITVTALVWLLQDRSYQYALRFVGSWAQRPRHVHDAA